MNSLSWFLYFADVVSRVGDMSAFIVFGVVALLGFGLVFSPLIAIMLDEIGFAEHIPIRTVVKTVLIFWCSALLVYVIVPAKNTMYAIAASEMGEKLAQNQAVQGIASDATKALQQWIKRQIEPEKTK